MPFSVEASPHASDHAKMLHYRAVLRIIAGSDPEANRQRADSLAMNALDRFGDL